LKVPLSLFSFWIHWEGSCKKIWERMHCISCFTYKGDASCGQPRRQQTHGNQQQRWTAILHYRSQLG